MSDGRSPMPGVLFASLSLSSFSPSFAMTDTKSSEAVVLLFFDPGPSEPQAASTSSAMSAVAARGVAAVVR